MAVLIPKKEFNKQMLRLQRTENRHYSSGAKIPKQKTVIGLKGDNFICLFWADNLPKQPDFDSSLMTY